MCGVRRRLTGGGIAAFVIVALAVSFAIAPPVPGLEIRNEANEPVARFAGICAFKLRHTHSVMKTPVEDHYVIEGRNRLVQTETRYRSLGAGLPFDSAGDLRREEGWFVQEGLNVELSHITVRVGRVSDQVLMIGDNEVPLRELDKPGKALTIRARTVLFSGLWI